MKQFVPHYITVVVGESQVFAEVPIEGVLVPKAAYSIDYERSLYDETHNITDDGERG